MEAEITKEITLRVSCRIPFTACCSQQLTLVVLLQFSVGSRR